MLCFFQLFSVVVCSQHSHLHNKHKYKKTNCFAVPAIWLKLDTVKIFPDYFFRLFVTEEENCAKAINPSLYFRIFRDKELLPLQWNCHLLIKLHLMTVTKMRKNMHLPTVSPFSLLEVNAEFIKLCFGEYCRLSNVVLWVLRKWV